MQYVKAAEQRRRRRAVHRASATSTAGVNQSIQPAACQPIRRKSHVADAMVSDQLGLPLRGRIPRPRGR